MSMPDTSYISSSQLLLQYLLALEMLTDGDGGGRPVAPANDYSYFSATTGSTPMARRAGM